MSTSQPLGIVAYSFALRRRDEEPNPCNMRIAMQTAQFAQKYPGAVVVAQWEVALGLARLGVTPDAVIDLPVDGSYLDSDLVWNGAKELFEQRGVKVTLPVAQRFLQLRKVRGLATKAGFAVEPAQVRPVGFDPSSHNTQWWTRGPVRLLAYAAMQGLFGYRGSNKTKFITG